MTIATLKKNIEQMREAYNFDDDAQIKLSTDMRSYRAVIEICTIDKERDVAIRLVKSIDTKGSIGHDSYTRELLRQGNQ